MIIGVLHCLCFCCWIPTEFIMRVQYGIFCNVASFHLYNCNFSDVFLMVVLLIITYKTYYRLPNYLFVSIFLQRFNSPVKHWAEEFNSAFRWKLRENSVPVVMVCVLMSPSCSCSHEKGLNLSFVTDSWFSSGIKPVSATPT